jgi:hypothetical protein
MLEINLKYCAIFAMMASIVALSGCCCCGSSIPIDLRNEVPDKVVDITTAPVIINDPITGTWLSEGFDSPNIKPKVKAIISSKGYDFTIDDRTNGQVIKGKWEFLSDTIPGMRGYKLTATVNGEKKEYILKHYEKDPFRPADDRETITIDGLWDYSVILKRI